MGSHHTAANIAQRIDLRNRRITGAEGPCGSQNRLGKQFNGVGPVTDRDRDRVGSYSDQVREAVSGETDRGRPLRVLSIDGGGMRGLYAAAYLSSLIQRYTKARDLQAIDIGRGFDLITGTSTGAIIACALAAGVSVDRVAALYRKWGAAIFPRRLPRRVGPELAWQLWKRPRYLKAGSAALGRALAAEFGETTLGDVWQRRRIAVAVPAVERSRNRSWVFKTPHLSNTLHRDDGYSLVDVCLASSAAPIYRSMARIENPDTPGHHVFVDGGLWANNPVLIGLLDAIQMTSPGDSIEIFCLGTCPRPQGELIGDRALHRGLVGWRFGGGVTPVAIEAQEFAFDNMARMLAPHVDRNCRILRFPHGRVSGEMMKHLDLDDASCDAMDALVAQAQTDMYATLSRCGDPADADGQLLHALLTDLPPRAPSR